MAFSRTNPPKLRIETTAMTQRLLGRRPSFARRVSGLFSFLIWLYLGACVAFVLGLAWYLSHRELDLAASVDDGLRDIPGECFGSLYDCLNKPVKR